MNILKPLRQQNMLVLEDVAIKQRMSSDCGTGIFGLKVPTLLKSIFLDSKQINLH